MFGHQVPMAPLVCGSFGQDPVPVTTPYVNLYVRLTDTCPANCPFCVAHGPQYRPFDFAGFRKMLAEVYGKAYIKKVALTGGEPTTRVKDLQGVLGSVKELDPRITVDLNTNGFQLHKLKGADWDRLGSVSLSRHHWDDDRNAKAFGLRNAFFNSKMIQACGHLDKLHLRCNLIRGFVDAQDTVLRYMQEMAGLGVHDFGFVALMPLNTWCTKHTVTPAEAGLMEPLPGALATKHWDSPRGSCSCRNYVLDVLGDGMPVRYYTRYESKPETCGASSLVWDVDRLTLGFGGEEIWRL